MTASDDTQAMVLQAIRALMDDPKLPLAAGTALIGDGSVLDSLKLVQLCLALEDAAGAAGFSFDWTSAAAMPRLRAMFRSAGALAAEFQSQMEAAR